MAKANTTPLTEAQREIMEVVWERDEVTVTEIRNLLATKGDVARNTIQTMIVRLEERGWLKHREAGRTFFYSAKRSRTASLGVKVAQMVDRLFAGSPEEMVTALMEYRGLSSDEAEIRKGARTSKTSAGAKRRSTIVTIFASLQTRIANFTLTDMLAEVERWTTAGVSLFQSELDVMKANLPPPEQNASPS